MNDGKGAKQFHSMRRPLWDVTSFAPIAAIMILTASVIRIAPVDAYNAHVLHFIDGYEVTNLNQWFSFHETSVTLAELTSAEFVRVGATGAPIPELVTVIPTQSNGGISRDGRTVTWHLRRGVRWSDGAPFDASDVTYTFRVAQNEVNDIIGRDVWDRLANVQAPDGYTVVFRFKAPYAPFITAYFTAAAFCILPRHVLGPGTNINHAQFNSLPVGIGPFRYTAFRRGNSVEMEANPYYWRGKPKLRRIIYKIVTDPNTALIQLMTGEVDLWEGIRARRVSGTLRLRGKSWIQRLSPNMVGIWFNTAHVQLKEPRVRRALRLATDRNLIFRDAALGNGLATETIFPTFAVGHTNLSLSFYDPRSAEAELDQAGWRRARDGVRAKNGVPLTLDIVLAAGDSTVAAIAAFLQNDYAKIGVATTLHFYSGAQLFAPYSDGGVLFTGKFDVALHFISFESAFADVDGALTCDALPPKGQNETRYCSRGMDQENARYVGSYDLKVEQDAATALQRRIDEDVPVIMLYESAAPSVFDERFTGYHPNSFSHWGDPMQLDI